MTRAAYEAARRKARDAIDSREDRGLPHHPDPSGRLTCPDCEGHGEIEVPVYDPQDAYGLSCDRCGGDGMLTEGRGEDVLVALRRARSLRRLGATYSWRYDLLRTRAFRRVSGLPLTEMLAWARRCVTRTEEARRSLAA